MAVVSCIWKAVRTSGIAPTARHGMSAQLVEGKVYVFGGCHSETEGKLVFYNDLHLLSVQDTEIIWETVEQAGDVPSPRDSHSMCYIDHDLYLFGGKDQLVSEKCITGISKFSTDRALWSKLHTTGQQPSAVSFSAGPIKRKIFVFGGICNGTATNDMFVFDIDNNCWETIQPCGIPPSPRCDHGFAIVEGILYIQGGSGGQNCYYNDLHSYDPETNCWHRPDVRGLLPYPRAGHKFVAHRNKDIYLIGGYNETCDDASTCLLGTYKYSLGSKKWKRPVAAGICMPDSPLHGHDAFILHSALYVLGGIEYNNEETMQRIRTLKLINPSERKPVIEHLLDDFCVESSPSCWSPTEKPSVSYSVDSTSNETENHIRSLSVTEKTLPLNNALTSGDLMQVNSVELHMSLQRAARAELASARQAFENERVELIRLVDKERSETRALMEKHKKQNESWWQARIQENDTQRRKITVAGERILSERKVLANEREILETKAKQVAQLLKQITNV